MELSFCIKYDYILPLRRKSANIISILLPYSIDSSISKIKSGTLRVDMRFPNSLRINPLARNKALVAASRRFSPPSTE